MELQEWLKKLESISVYARYGEIKHNNKNHLVSKGPACKIGDLCEVGEKQILCEVTALKEEKVYLTPVHQMEGIQISDQVRLREKKDTIFPVHYYLGRVIDAFGEFIDNGVRYKKIEKKEIELDRDPPPPLKRRRIKEIMETKIKAIDTLLTLGKGQKIGIFSGSGVGKSTLLGMIAKRAKADVNVVALIGERGREVLDFMERDLGEEGMKRTVMVVCTSDERPLMRIRATQLATSIAEEFRDQGNDVLLMVDSVTRFAMAHREIDFANGEISVMGGKTPSIEPAMQRLLERSGTNEKGSITGIYTVLVESDDLEAPIPDIARGILDGHILLTRQLFQSKHYPAIDILNSVSRVMPDVVSPEHQELASEVVKIVEKYKENEDMFRIGGYFPGMDSELDRAVQLYPKINQFLQQSYREFVPSEESLSELKEILET